MRSSFVHCVTVDQASADQSLCGPEQHHHLLTVSEQNHPDPRLL